MVKLKPTSQQLDRLNLVRYLFGQAQGQGQEPQPICSIAILALHDSAELLLDIIAESNNTKIPPKSTFMEYWKFLEKSECQIKLPMQREMEKLNTARVSLKHHGQRGSEDQVREHIFNTENFLRIACEQVFSVDLFKLSAANFIKNQKIREYIEIAIELLDLEEFGDCYGHLASAFHFGLSIIYKRSPFLFRGEQKFILPSRRFGLDSSSLQQLNSLIKPVEDAINQMNKKIENVSDYSRRGLALVSLGIELRDYEFFLSRTPEVSFVSRDNSPALQWLSEIIQSRADALFCINFVVKFILKIESNRFS